MAYGDITSNFLADNACRDWKKCMKADRVGWDLPNAFGKHCAGNPDVNKTLSELTLLRDGVCLDNGPNSESLFPITAMIHMRNVPTCFLFIFGRLLCRFC
jgi:hypothetical protein